MTMNKPARILIVDDEELCRANLRHAIAAHPGLSVTAECANVASARRAIAGQRPDVIFLDIQMPEESGMALAHELALQEAPPIIVFTTAYQHYAVQAFEFHALDYLLKPFDDERFERTVKRLRELLALRRLGDGYGDALRSLAEESSGARPYAQRICIRSIGQIESVTVADIDWVISSGNYVELHLGARMVLHRTTMAALEERLDPRLFLRVHRRVIVRRDQCALLRVTGDGTYQLVLHSGDAVPVSERFVGEVRQLLSGG